MSFKVPDYDSSSSSPTLSFQSTLEAPLSLQLSPLQNMTGLGNDTSEIQMDNKSIQDPLAGLTIDDKWELLLILQQK